MFPLPRVHGLGGSAFAGMDEMPPDVQSGGSMCSNGNKGVEGVPVHIRRRAPPQWSLRPERNSSMRLRAVPRSSLDTA